MPAKSISKPLFSLIKDLMTGFCLGVANIIPGVSGGTFLLVLGIYEKVFSIVNRITPSFLSRFFSLLREAVKAKGVRAGVVHGAEFLKNSGLLYLLRLGTGALLAILLLSGGMAFLLTHHFVYTYSLFLGLILVSVVVPVRMMGRLSLAGLGCMVLGAGLTIAVTLAVNPYDKIRIKSQALGVQFQAEDRDFPSGGKEVSRPEKGHRSTGRYSPGEYLYIAACGALAISATVLPGISGSLVMILLGAYYDVIFAISRLKNLDPEAMAYLGVFALGVLVGGLLFTRLVGFVFKRFYEMTIAFLTGLMAGSLYALWPFKQTLVMAEQYVRDGEKIVLLKNVLVQTNLNVLPGADAPLAGALACFLLGGGIMAGFLLMKPGQRK